MAQLKIEATDPSVIVTVGAHSVSVPLWEGSIALDEIDARHAQGGYARLDEIYFLLVEFGLPDDAIPAEHAARRQAHALQFVLEFRALASEVKKKADARLS